MFKRLVHYYQKLPFYLAYRATPWTAALWAPYLYFRRIPQHQDVPLFIFTMGKVGTKSLWRSLLHAGVYFIKTTHYYHRVSGGYYPFRKPVIVQMNRSSAWEHRLYYPWLMRRPLVRVITMVREPIGRIVSLYLFSYTMRYGVKIEDVSLQTLLDNFMRLFEREYEHPLVPGYFMTEELGKNMGIDVYQPPFPRENGVGIIEEKNISLLLMKLEIPDERKAEGMSTWMGRSIDIIRWNTADQEGYGEVYAEFKRQVRFPYRYAEAMYKSAYMQHFYTPAERAKFWQRWEPQLDRSLVLPDWIEKQLQAYHPPVDG